MLLACVTLSTTSAEAASPAGAFATKLGNLQITLPLPIGFVDPSSAPADMVDLLSRNFGPKQRFMALLIPKDYLDKRAAGDPAAEMSRYFIVHTFRGFEDSGMSRAGFEANKASIRHEGAQQMKSAEERSASTVDRMSKEVGTRTGDPAFSTKVGASAAVGVFDETPNSIAWASIGPVPVTSSQGTKQTSLVRVVALVLVHDRPVNLLGYAAYNSPSDLVWIEQQTRDWVRRVGELNP